MIIKTLKQYTILQNQKKENMLKEMDFYHSEKNYLTNRENNYQVLLNKTGVDALKTVIKKVAAATGEFTGNIIPDKTVKPKPNKELKS